MKSLWLKLVKVINMSENSIRLFEGCQVEIALEASRPDPVHPGKEERIRIRGKITGYKKGGPVYFLTGIITEPIRELALFSDKRFLFMAIFEPAEQIFHEVTGHVIIIPEE